jgi:hypothetical protein
MVSGDPEASGVSSESKPIWLRDKKMARNRAIFLFDIVYSLIRRPAIYA